MKVERLDRVIYNVKDLNRSTKLLEELFGTRFDYLGELSDDKGNLYVDAVSPLGIGLLERIKPPEKQEGLRAIVYKVSDLDEAMADMEKHGFKRLRLMQHGKLREATYDVFGISTILSEYNDDIHNVMAAFLLPEKKSISASHE